MISKIPEKSEHAFDVDEVIQNASLSEKVSLLAGLDFWHTAPLPRFNVPSIRLSDGPNGVRGTKFFSSVPAACLPCGTGLASTWDQSLLHQAGILIGEECKAKGASCWLGPTVNIQRSPLGGRGFESMSEDPYLSGKLAGSYINGTQSTGIISALKHWVANDQEHERLGVNVMVNDRALREIYMLPFQIAISDSSPGAIMSAYNRVNGTHVSESKNLLDGVLRDEWGWKGLILSDWFGTYSTTESLNAGLDLEMPGPARLRGTLADLAVSSRKVTRSTIDARVRNVLEFAKRASQVLVSEEEGERDLPEDRALNRKLAADSIVLLKNDAGILPLPKDIKSIALIGPNLKNVAYCGGGSASLEPYYAISPFQGIVEKLPKDTTIHYEIGAHSHGFLPVLKSLEFSTPEGLPGCRMRFYAEPPSVPNRKIVDEVVVLETSWQLMGFSHPLLERLFYVDLEGNLVAPASGKFEFGVAVYGSACLYIDDRLIIDNTNVQRGGSFFFGKGTLEEKAVVDMIEGQTYKVRLEFGSAPTSKLVKPGVVNFGGGAGRVGFIQMVEEDEAIERAVKVAKENKYTIICAGLSKDWESEGFDRPDMELPGALSKLITAVVAANPNTIIVSQSGTPINMLPWADHASSHLHSCYGGNEIGNGIADVIFGDVNPSGKLPLSFPRRIEDTPTYLNFGSERGRVEYGESIYLGYRYYEKVMRDVLYPFGYGLSYTTFSYSNLHVTSQSATLTVTNTGSRPGAEVIQLYIAADPMTSSIKRPKKELKGFSKVFLQPRESQQVEIPFDRFSTVFWDEVLNEWVSEKGSYRVLVGRSSTDIVVEGVLAVPETTTWSGL